MNALPVRAAERRASAGARDASRTGLLVDWGGVMTPNLFESFNAFCLAEGLDLDAVASIFRHDRQARELLFALEEGRLAEEEFERGLAERLGLASAVRLIDRLFPGMVAEPAMIEAVRAARSAGVYTGLISNSWGTGRYPRDLLEELFDAVVISGEIGIRKPARRIYELGAEALGLDPRQCVFVDDLAFNLDPARELGMAVVHHTAPPETIAQLRELLAISL
jgi:putative hydrolase of the HAD superfamily